jgi:hypothetical protein
MPSPFDLTASNDDHPSFTGMKVEVRERVFDASQQNLAQNEVAQLIDVAAGEHVLGVTCRVLTADANAGTAEIGDGSDTNGFLEAFNDAAAAETHYPFKLAVTLSEGTPNTIAYNGYTNGGKYYSAADTIDFKALGASGVTTGKYLVTAFVVPKSRAA